MQNLPVTLMLDRAGLVGNDGETHQGVFDLSYLTMIPNMTVFAPKNRYEFQDAIALLLILKHRWQFAIQKQMQCVY